MTQPPWIPYTVGDPVPMGVGNVRYDDGGEWTALGVVDWPNVTHYQRHPDHQLIADMRDAMCKHISGGFKPLILRAEAIVGRAPGLPEWLVEYLDGGA